MARLLDAHPKTKVEFIDTLSNVTDISAYYQSGAQFQQVKERAPDEIQAGNFDIVCFNHDNKFSEYDPTSMLYGVQYHGARLRISQGFVLPDGTEEYVTQAVGYIDELAMGYETSADSVVTFRCRDIIKFLLDQKLNPRPFALVPVAGSSNVGTGGIPAVDTKPFKTKNENWTLTCTTPGSDGVAIFSVSGSVSGSIGNATSGTEFNTLVSAGGIKFTITAGGTAWATGDVFTFTTKQHAEWTSVNAGKIIWSVLTGYDWDSNTAETWSGRVLAFDHTQSDSNTQLDYNSFVTVIANLTSIGSFNLTGAVYYDEDCVSFLQELTMLFIGSIFTGQDGRLKISSYVPTFSPIALATFTDALKIDTLGYNRTIDEVINYVVVTFKGTNVWEFDDETLNLDGSVTVSNATSITAYGALEETYSTRWFNTNAVHVTDFATKLVGKYSDPPLNLNFDTGGDALLTQIGDPVAVTDTKYKLSLVYGEVSMINKQLDQNPVKIQMRVRREADLSVVFGFCGSEANEGDGISPQTDNYAIATTTDKFFAYFSQTGQTVPDYRMF